MFVIAIYHFSAKIIGRSGGKSSVASAAYRAREKIHDDRQDMTFNYSRKTDLSYSEILAPVHAPAWVHDRQKLWNAVERIEDRSNSQLAREFVIALPCELNLEEQKELLKNFIQTEFVDRGMIADVNLHFDNHVQKERDLVTDAEIGKNPHAHIMLTTREIEHDGNWTEKKNRDWNAKALLYTWREKWAEHANQALEKANRHERIDHRSHKTRGLEQIPTIDIGADSWRMEKKGIKTTLGDINRQIKKFNKTKIVHLNKYKLLQEVRQKVIDQSILLMAFDMENPEFALILKEKLDIEGIWNKLKTLPDSNITRLIVRDPDRSKVVAIREDLKQQIIRNKNKFQQKEPSQNASDNPRTNEKGKSEELSLYENLRAYYNIRSIEEAKKALECLQAVYKVYRKEKDDYDKLVDKHKNLIRDKENYEFVTNYLNKMKDELAKTAWHQLAEKKDLKRRIKEQIKYIEGFEAPDINSINKLSEQLNKMAIDVKDKKDIIFLVKYLGIDTEDKANTILNTTFKEDFILPKTRYVIEECLDPTDVELTNDEEDEWEL